MPQELWVTNTDFGGRPAEAAVAVKFVHKGIPAKKAQKKRANAGGAGFLYPSVFRHLPPPVCLYHHTWLSSLE